MVLFEDDNINFYPVQIDPEEGLDEDTTYHDMNLLLFWDIRKTKGGMKSDLDLEEMSKYLEFSVI